MKKYIFVLILIGLIIPLSSAITIGKYVDPGATIFIGEEGLNITEAVGTSEYIGWWASAANIYTTSPDRKIAISSRKDSFTASPSDFVYNTGNWYRLDASDKPVSTAFNIVDPYLDMTIFNDDAGVAINDGKIALGTNVKFRIDTNMYTLNSNRHTEYGLPTSEGFIDIHVKSSNGASYTHLMGSDVPLTNIFPVSPQQYWGGVWQTDYMNNGIYAFDGEYTIYAESKLNGMKDNYRYNGNDYTGKTISASKKVTIGSSDVSIAVNRESITRGRTFSVTITGKPYTDYYLWVSKTNDLDGIHETAPQIQPYQSGVTIGDGGDHISHDNIKIKNDVPQNTSATNPYYAIIKTDSNGKITVGFSTSVLTKSRDYIIRIEDASASKYDEIEITVEKGGMTITSNGNQIYYMGETIKFEGVNTESPITYLYVYGPNLPIQGANINSNDPRNSPVSNDNASTFKQITVNGDGTWSWNWNTNSIALDAGTYIIYAVSQPKSKSYLLDTPYATTSISFRKPTLSATTSQSTIAKGDKLKITGFAEGDPGSIAIWIMGKNYAHRDTTNVDSRSEFNYELNRAETEGMASGQYLVIIQHPMQNDQFDIVLNSDGSVSNLQLGTNASGTTIFQYSGVGSLQGTDAATALIKAIDDPNIDDMYTKLVFTIMEPIIIIDDIGKKYIGDKITITGKTNLAVDTNLMIDITSSTFKPTNKSEPNEFAGASISTSVYADDNELNNGYNRFLVTVDTSTFKPDEYIVTASAIESDVSDSTNFIVSGEPKPANITTTTTTIAPYLPATVSTTVPTPTIAPTPTPSPTDKKLPGFNAVFACIGLLIVGWVIVSRN